MNTNGKLLLAVMVLACCVAAEKNRALPETAEFRRIALVDENGTVVGVFEGAEGGCRVSLSSRGKEVMRVSAHDAACMIYLGASEGVNEAGSPLLPPFRIGAGAGIPGITIQQGGKLVVVAPGRVDCADETGVHSFPR